MPIHAIGGTGVFVKEVQEAVLDGATPTSRCTRPRISPRSPGPEGIVLAAVPERADARDVLVGSTLDDLPAGGHVGTGSVRRRAQLAALRPDLTFAELRGNVPTRLDRAGEFDAIVVAAAALVRLGRDRRGRRVPGAVGDAAPGRPGCARGGVPHRRRRDPRAVARDRRHPRPRRGRGRARAFLAQLGGGCDLPCGAHATLDGTAVVIEALLAALDGHVVLRARPPRDASPVTAGTRVATELLARGGRSLLDDGAA